MIQKKTTTKDDDSFVWYGGCVRPELSKGKRKEMSLLVLLLLVLLLLVLPLLVLSLLVLSMAHGRRWWFYGRLDYLVVSLLYRAVCGTGIELVQYRS
jgi:hypothetical protein